VVRRGRFCRPLLVLVLTIALGACGGGGGGKKTAKSTTTIATTTTLSTTSAPSATATTGTTATTTVVTTPPQASVAKLDTRVDTAQGNVTVYAYENPASPPNAAPRPGDVFADIDAEGCAGPNAGPNAGIAPQAFRLQIDQSAYYPVGTSKEPALRATKLAPGQCGRGWVTFEIPQGARPQYALFEGSKVVAWQLP